MVRHIQVSPVSLLSLDDDRDGGRGEGRRERVQVLQVNVLKL